MNNFRNIVWSFDLDLALLQWLKTVNCSGGNDNLSWPVDLLPAAQEEHVWDLRLLQQYWWEFRSPEMWCSVTERDVRMFSRFYCLHLQEFFDFLTLEGEGTTTIHQTFRNQTPNNTLLHPRKSKFSRPYWHNTNAVTKVLVIYFFNKPSCTRYSENSGWIVSAYIQVIIRPVYYLEHMKNTYHWLYINHQLLCTDYYLFIKC